PRPGGGRGGLRPGLPAAAQDRPRGDLLLRVTSPAGGSAGRQGAARPGAGGRAPLLLLDLQRDVDELVLLAAAEATFARADGDLGRRHAVALGVALGVLEERRVATGVAEHHGLPVDDALGRHERAHHVLGGIGDTEEVDAGGDAELVAHAHERLDGRVAGAGTEAPGGAVDLLGARA